MKKLLIIIPTLIIASLVLLLTVDYVMLAKETNPIISRKEETINLDSSLFTQKDSEESVVQNPINFEEDGFVQDFENEKMVFYSNSSTGAIRLYVKETGYTWCSDVLDADSEKYDLNNAGIRQVQSAFTMIYRDETDKVQSVRTKESRIQLTKSVNNNVIKFKVKDTKSNISFAYSITIKENKIVFLLDYNSIEEGKCRLTSLTFFPYLGSAYKKEVSGYVFIPSASGALVRFNQESTISSMYSSSFYGEDANITINNEGDLLNLPIYGIVHGINQNAILVNIKDGATFAKFNYSPASIDKNFHLAYPTFNYRETYQMNFSGNSILVIPTDYYKNNVEIEYTILTNENANYCGMAKDYQKTLISDGILTKQNSTASDISIDIEAFGRDYETGLILKKYYNMTTTKDIIDIDASLKENGISNLFYMLRAFNKKGYSNQSVSNYKFDSKLGKLKDLKELDAYFYFNPVESYNSTRNYPSKVLINLYNEKNYIKVGVDKYKFYANIRAIEKYTTKAIEYYDAIGLDGLGYRLYGDHNNNLSKTEALAVLKNILKDKKYIMYSPNYYFLGNTSKYLNMPLYSERLRFYTDSVPFLEILLKGYIDYYSPYLNFSSNEKVDVLKCIEFGCYPAYLVTKEESYKLADTLSSNYYATTFDKCKANIINNYKYINEALKQVINAEIINRTTLEVGIYLVSYSNGKSILVNYTNSDYLYNSITVSSLGYEVF